MWCREIMRMLKLEGGIEGNSGCLTSHPTTDAGRDEHSRQWPHTALQLRPCSMHVSQAGIVAATMGRRLQNGSLHKEQRTRLSAEG